METLLHVILALAVGWGLVAIYRWVHGQSRPLGAIVAAGYLLQAGAGLALFWISHLDLPFLRGLHTSDGFWVMAPDARDYILKAAGVIDTGTSAIATMDPSPAFVHLLAAGMYLFGASPAVGMFVNLALYALLCGLLVWIWKPRNDWSADLPCAVLLGSLTFSPVLVMHGTQALKDNVYALLTAVACVGMWLLLPMLSSTQPFTVRSRRRWLLGLGLFVLSLAAMAGIRYYHPFFVWAGLAAVLVVLVLPFGRRRPVRALVLSAAVLAPSWAACLLGAPDDALAPAVASGAVRGVVTGDTVQGGRIGAVREAFAQLDTLRAGFVRTTGSSNVQERRPGVRVRTEGRLGVGVATDDELAAFGLPVGSGALITGFRTGSPAALAGIHVHDLVLEYDGTRVRSARELTALVRASEPGDVVRMEVVRNGQPIALDVPVGAGDIVEEEITAFPGFMILRRLAVGVATVFVPVSLLQALSIASDGVGRGLLFLADIDTLFIDVTIAAIGFLLYRRWSHARQHLPYIGALVLLGAITAVTLGYVIVNYGTLFRLRAMVAVPFWMLALAVAPARETDGLAAATHPATQSAISA